MEPLIVVLSLVIVGLLAFVWDQHTKLDQARQDIVYKDRVMQWADEREARFTDIFYAMKLLTEVVDPAKLDDFMPAGVTVDGKWIPSKVGVDMMRMFFGQFKASTTTAKLALKELIEWEQANPVPQRESADAL